MNKIANVVYPYSPKNDDELELKVGDKIEVIGIEEEGWWKGTLKGRVGVFPSNFVQVVEQESPTSSASQNISKLNSLFGTRVGSKNSLSSSNSLNNINSNSSNNLNIQNNNSNSNNSGSKNNLIMNSTRQQHDIDSITTTTNTTSTHEYPFAQQQVDDSLHSTNSLSDRRPKPLRGIGFGDIFAQGAKAKPLPADPITRSSTSGALASERLGANIDSNTLGRLSSGTLQKQIPKKPPPPAPAEHTNNTNGSAADQAPALPPKPNNQFSPYLRPLPNPAAVSTASATQPQRVVREQARVIYAYKPSNDDELEMEVDDIIDIIDKKIEDAGWWKGELNGKIGVFPDNFVQLIAMQETQVTSDGHNSSRLSSSTAHSNSSNNSGVNSQHNQQHHHHHHQQASTGSMEGKPTRSVFASTPKGFCEELENNLASSTLNRNRMHMAEQAASNIGTESASAMTPLATSSLVLPDANQKQNGHTSLGSHEPTSPGKLNHITANRAKGPARRPPSNILNKRNQSSELGRATNNHKYEPNNDNNRDELLPASLPAFKQTSIVQPPSGQASLTSLPIEQQQPRHQLPAHSQVPSVPATPKLSPFASSADNDSSPPAPPLKTPPSNGLAEMGAQSMTPKTSQRLSQPPTIVGQPVDSKGKVNPTSAPSTPPWMVELRKTNAEKKRDPLPAANSVGLMEEMATSPVTTSSVPTTPATIASTTNAPTSEAPAITSTPPIAALAATTAPPLKPVVATANKPSSVLANDNGLAKPDEMLKHISKNVTDEIIELRNDVKKLQDDFKSLLGLKDTIETMKVELRTCQSATESQRKYIKELVNNLADERKRIAAMQTEIDRNLR